MKNQNKQEKQKSTWIRSMFVYFMMFTLTFAVSLGITQFDNLKHHIAPKPNTKLFDDQAFSLIDPYVALIEFEDLNLRFDRDAFLIINTSNYKEYDLGDFIGGFIDKYGDPKLCAFYFDRLFDDQCK